MHRFAGRPVLLGDGIKIPKSRRKMPAVNLQRSGSHLISRARRSSAAYQPMPVNHAPRGRGRSRTFGLRFKIELSFKQALRVIGVYADHFWMRSMPKIARASQGSLECGTHKSTTTLPGENSRD